jgi:hypothetical protein
LGEYVSPHRKKIFESLSIRGFSRVVGLKAGFHQNGRRSGKMKYMLLIYHDEQSWDAVTEADRQQIYLEYRNLREQLQKSGQFVTGSQLQPVTTATTVRVRDGKELITDGPFAETHEQLGGYFLIEARDLDEATSIAAKIPSARTGTIEVRPLVEAAAEATA